MRDKNTMERKAQKKKKNEESNESPAKEVAVKEEADQKPEPK